MFMCQMKDQRTTNTGPTQSKTSSTTSHCSLIIVGDLNAYPNKMDSVNPNANPSQHLKNLIKNNTFKDTYRSLILKRKEYTWTAHGKAKTQLDTVLLSTDMRVIVQHLKFTC